MQLRRLREQRGYSLEELAERSGLSFRGLIYIEHGKRNPSALTLVDIPEALGVAPGELINHLAEGTLAKPRSSQIGSSAHTQAGIGRAAMVAPRRAGNSRLSSRPCPRAVAVWVLLADADIRGLPSASSRTAAYPHPSKLDGIDAGPVAAGVRSAVGS
ncbi:helix-turn-helix domain-containing protein [Streptomyces sp. NPDC001858]